MSRRPRRTARPAAGAARPTGWRQSGVAGLAGRLAALLLLGWLGGFLWFSLALPGPAPLDQRTDAVVVLTGGEGRLRRGVAVIDAGAASRLLVSGVGRRTTRRQLAEAAGFTVARLAKADLGYAAIDTRSNAEETAQWMRRHGFASLRLVTSAGHMRRARLELARALPADVTVLADAVPIEPRAPGIAWEYSKWLARRTALLTGAD